MGNSASASNPLDLVHPLSTQQRQERLCYGYIRIQWKQLQINSTIKKQIPNELCRICHQYIGIDNLCIRSPTEIQQAIQRRHKGAKMYNTNSEYMLDLLTAPPDELSNQNIHELQTELAKSIKNIQNLEMELKIRFYQVEQMEDNLRLVADQSKMIGIRAMEQEMKFIETKTALKLATKQLSLYKKSEKDTVLSDKNDILPINLRCKFNEFFQNVLESQKEYFKHALKYFVETNFNDNVLQNEANLDCDTLISKISNIGNSLIFDYIKEWELRLTNVFSSQNDTNYTLQQ